VANRFAEMTGSTRDAGALDGSRCMLLEMLQQATGGAARP
jgi:hypothetical protein